MPSSKLISLFLLVVLLSPKLKAQWEFAYVSPNRTLYNGLCMINDSVGFAAATTANPNSIFRTYIFKTEDYWNSFDTIYEIDNLINSTQDLIQDVFFLNDTLGWAVGRLPFTLKTTDGGQQWMELYHTPALNHNEVVFLDSLYGLRIPNGTGQTYAITNDGGVSWRVDTLGYDTRDVTLFDSCHFYLNNDGAILKRENCIDEIIPFPTLYSNPRRTGTSIHIINDSLWILGALGNYFADYFSSILRSNDAGNTWQITDFPFGGGMACFEFINDSVGYAGTGGSINHTGFLKTLDAGITWYEQQSPLDILGYHIGALDIECADNYCYALNGFSILRTSNGGGPLGQAWTGQVEEEAKPENTMTLFPNPAQNEFHLNGLEAHRKYQVDVFDLAGKMIVHESVFGNASISTTTLPAGMYVVRCVSENHISALPLMIER